MNGFANLQREIGYSSEVESTTTMPISAGPKAKTIFLPHMHYHAGHPRRQRQPLYLQTETLVSLLNESSFEELMYQKYKKFKRE